MGKIEKRNRIISINQHLLIGISILGILSLVQLYYLIKVYHKINIGQNYDTKTFHIEGGNNNVDNIKPSNNDASKPDPKRTDRYHIFKEKLKTSNMELFILNMLDIFNRDFNDWETKYSDFDKETYIKDLKNTNKPDNDIIINIGEFWRKKKFEDQNVQERSSYESSVDSIERKHLIYYKYFNEEVNNALASIGLELNSIYSHQYMQDIIDVDVKEIKYGYLVTDKITKNRLSIKFLSIDQYEKELLPHQMGCSFKHINYMYFNKMCNDEIGIIISEIFDDSLDTICNKKNCLEYIVPALDSLLHLHEHELIHGHPHLANFAKVGNDIIIFDFDKVYKSDATYADITTFLKALRIEGIMFYPKDEINNNNGDAYDIRDELSTFISNGLCFEIIENPNNIIILENREYYKDQTRISKVYRPYVGKFLLKNIFESQIPIKNVSIYELSQFKTNKQKKIYFLTAINKMIGKSNKLAYVNQILLKWKLIDKVFSLIHENEDLDTYWVNDKYNEIEIEDIRINMDTLKEQATDFIQRLFPKNKSLFYD